jgi:hypothetical protein
MDAIAPDPEEAARRLRAAIAYAGMSQPDAARVIGKGLSTLARTLDAKGGELRAATWDEVWKIADACGLPRAWFTADLTRLQEIVPDGQPRFANDSGSFRPSAAQMREAQELRREAQRSRARQPASRRTKREPKRRRNEAD